MKLMLLTQHIVVNMLLETILQNISTVSDTLHYKKFFVFLETHLQSSYTVIDI